MQGDGGGIVKRIGLIRHFEVNCPLPAGWFTCDQFMDWRERYDVADVTPISLDLGNTPWEHCLSSDLTRALQTAQAAYKGVIDARADLREVETAPLGSNRLRLPVSGWRWAYRLAWMTNHVSQREVKQLFLARVQALALELMADSRQNILVVSHAGVMIFLRRELAKLGFAGESFKIPANGRLYLLEKRADV